CIALAVGARPQVLESGEIHAGSLDPRGDGADDHDDEGEDPQGHEREPGDLDGPVATRDLRTSGLAATNEVAGLAVGAEVGDLLDAVGVVEGDLRDVLPNDAALLACAGFGQLRAADGRRVHGAESIASRPRRVEHWP